MSDVYDGYWETDEFEDLVARSIIGMHETNVKKTKKTPKSLRFNEDVFKRFKSTGCYFAPHDRLCYIESNENRIATFTQEIDVRNDGIPKKASLTTIPPEPERDGYLNATYLEQVPFLPKPFKSEIHGRYFRFMQLFFQNNYVAGYGSFIVISNEGKVQSCYSQDFYVDPITKREIHFKNRPRIENNTGTYQDYFSAWGSITVQFYQDRRYLWNVQAHDGTAKSTFGVYPEQIKSLFYARDLPQTDTGRKRPILHWVSAHQRRMKSGTDVDIEQYLRGTHEFVMNGTQFKITNPLKNRL